jgi:hypothetical protein
MTHFPGDARDAFIEASRANDLTVTLCRSMLGCSDIVPGDDFDEAVSRLEKFGIVPDDRTYDGVARAYLDLLAEDE